MADSSVKRVRLVIEGMLPGLLFNSKNAMALDASTKQTKQRTKEEEAELSAHWIGKGSKRLLGLPWVALYKSIVKAAGRFRFKGQEKMSGIVAATLACEGEMISLGTSEYKVFSDWVRIPPKTGGMVLKGRALLPFWRAECVLLIDDEFYPADKLKEVVATAGKLVGVLANRPENKGNNGRFVVKEWEPLA